MRVLAASAIVLALAACGDDEMPRDAEARDATNDARDGALDAPMRDGSSDADASRDATLDDDARPTEDATVDAMPGGDSDGDLLPDTFELAAGDTSLLDPARADSDGDGTDDGDEDPDGDGLRNSAELASARIAHLGADADPFRKDLLIELDAMDGKPFDDAAIAAAAAAYADAPIDGVAGRRGIGLVVYRDETAIAAMTFDGSFEQRHAFLAAHDGNVGDGLAPAFPTGALLHVIVASTRTDLPTRGGEAITHTGGGIETTGVLLYYDAIAAVITPCDNGGMLAPVTFAEGLASAFVHEVGHALQLGHDTDVGGATNYFNVMSVPTRCTDAQKYFHGLGNTDPALGATEAAMASRFSAEAAALMRFDAKLSVDTTDLVGGTGVDM